MELALLLIHYIWRNAEVLHVAATKALSHIYQCPGMSCKFHGEFAVTVTVKGVVGLV